MTLHEALEKGLIPFSVIETATKYCEKHGVDHIAISTLFDAIDKAEDAGTLSEYGLGDELQSVTMMRQLEHVGNIVEPEVLELKSLMNAGWQVDVDVFKPSGKFAYSGLVSLGQVMPFDDLLPVIIERQTFMTELDPNYYSIAVNDTRVNHEDHNYRYCAKRLFVAKEKQD